MLVAILTLALAPSIARTRRVIISHCSCHIRTSSCTCAPRTGPIGTASKCGGRERFTICCRAASFAIAVTAFFRLRLCLCIVFLSLSLTYIPFLFIVLRLVSRLAAPHCLPDLQESAPDYLAVIRKRYGQSNLPELTDADCYDIEFSFLDHQWRPLVFAATLVIDWLYFHRL